MTNLEMTTQLSYAAGNAANSVNAIVAFVLRLLTFCCPTAIVWFIIAFLVRPSVNFESWRTFTHISKESLERIFPLLAYSDAFRPVSSKLRFIWIQAPLDKIAPRIVSARNASAFGVPVLEVAGRDGLVMETAAGFGMAADEVDVQCDDFFSAVARSATSSVSVIGWQVGVNQNPCKTFTNQGLSFWHGIGSLSAVQVTGAWLQPSVCCDFPTS